MLTALQSGLVRGAFLVSLGFRSETVNLWTGFGPLTYNSITYSGAGSILSIGQMEEGSTVEARGTTISLSGIDPAIVPEVLADYKLGSTYSVMLACFNTSGSIIADPIVAFAGRMDKATSRVSGKTATIDIAMETRLLDMNVAIDRRRTSDDQQQLVPSDLGFSFANGCMEITLLFGSSQITTRNV